ncbi:hypothetical protein J6590_097976 [Homalodisca vitripennis]|nr:hypothetical protein J6590_097976 [Homalodisca vitripennis]
MSFVTDVIAVLHLFQALCEWWYINVLFNKKKSQGVKSGDCGEPVNHAKSPVPSRPTPQFISFEYIFKHLATPVRGCPVLLKIISSSCSPGNNQFCDTPRYC